MIEEFSLDGKTAIVTGAGRGLGQSICLAMADAGADIVAVARTEKQIDETCSEIRKRGRRGIPVAADVTDAAQVEGMVARTMAEFGKIDVLVNNAGSFLMRTAIPSPDLKTHYLDLLPDLANGTSVEDWQYQMNVNVTSAFLASRAVGAHMVRRASGKIINIASAAALRAYPYHTAYGASKAALVSLTRQLAVEWARYKINVNAIAPGYFKTSQTEWAHQDQKAHDAMASSVPMRGFADPRAVGMAVVFLSSRASDYVTGCTIPVDGGLHL